MSYRPRHAAEAPPIPPGQVDLAWAIVAVCAALLISFVAAGVIW